MSDITKRKSDCYCINLRRTTHVVTNLYDDMLKPTGLSVNQYSLLINLSRLKTASVSDLATYVGLERTTVVRSLKPIIDRGLIEDKSDVGMRDRQLCVSVKGMEVLEIAKTLWEKAQIEIEERIGKENVSKLYEILSMLSD